MNKWIFTVVGSLFLAPVAAQVSDKAISRAEVLQMVLATPARFGLTATEVAGSRVSDHYRDRKTGITHTYIQQYVHGFPVLNGILGVHLSAAGIPVHHTHNFVTFSVNPAPLSAPALDPATLWSKLDAREFVKPDFAQFRALDPGAGRVKYSESDKYHYQCWYAQDGQLIPAVNFIFFNPENGDWLNIITSENGTILDQINWTSHCSFSVPGSQESHAVHSQDSSRFHSLSFTVESPLYGSRSMLINPHDTVASPFGWLDDDGFAGADYTYTRGNNVWASEDRNADNVPGYSPDGGQSLFFDFAFDPAETDPLNYQDFAIVNLFVANNMLHDILYHYGFDENSGNFQLNNYSRGGVADDEVLADAQDGSGTNNANFSSPPDGSNPRMQMYIWDATSMGGATLRINGNPVTSFKVGRAQFGTQLTAVPITADMIYVNDGVGNGRKGCKTLKNASALNGKIAAIERGGCLFVDKVLFAQNAGAIAAVILDTSSADVLVTMSGTNSQITIPSVFVKLSNAGELQEILFGGPANISLYDSTGTMPRTDSDLDLGVIAHEYGHGLSIRLTCGPSVSNGLGNAEQMGEGWSDYLGLALTVKNGDLGSTPRGIGNWLIGEGVGGGGIRTYPYSTNMTVNPHTYKNVMLNSVSGRTEVHYLGEIWCAMLWDMHWKFIEKYGYDNNLYTGNGGNNMALQLVVEAMKLQKCQPGFVDGRNAILKADSLLNGAANSRLIWETFARRGLGYSASQGSSFSTADGTEAFNLPPALSSQTFDMVPSMATLRPNPSRDWVFVEPMNVARIDRVELYDMNGRFISIQAKYHANGALALPVSELSAGIYTVKVFAGEKHQSLRLQKI